MLAGVWTCFLTTIATITANSNNEVYHAMPEPESVATTELHHFLGAVPLANQVTRFTLWAPAHQRVAVSLVDQSRTVEMSPGKGGYHTVEIEGVGPGDRYFYKLTDGNHRPDPASRYQGDGVHGPSQVVQRDFDWSDQAWQAIPVQNFIIYELHVGTFTDGGTFCQAIDRLDELVDLGITAIELMPVADAAGRWNWGYDGVCLFAPNHNYGTPDDLKRLVDAAHAKGLAVILDVVYNHLGPEGNYWGQFGPYLSPKHATPWGDAPNFDCPNHGRELRRLVIANAIHWYDDFHVDALRVDAIHCMKDDSEPHVVVELSQAIQSWASQTGRQATLIAESNVYNSEMLTPQSQGGIGFDAQWCDDFLHSVLAVVRPDQQLCHRSYKPLTDLDQTLRMGYVYQGSLREPASRRSPTSRVDTSGLIYSIQNHDFIGNHPHGQRLHQLTTPETQAAAATLLILVPAIPMLFMGEEFCSDNPFRFFVDFGDQHLRDAVDSGRRQEYPQHDWDSGLLPTDERTFAESKIGPADSGNLSIRKWYQSLIQTRKAWQASGLLCDQNLTVETDLDQGIFQLIYRSDRESAIATVRLTAGERATKQWTIPLADDILLNSRPNEVSLQSNHAVVSFVQHEPK